MLPESASPPAVARRLLQQVGLEMAFLDPASPGGGSAGAVLIGLLAELESAVVVAPEPAGAGAWAFWCVACTVVCLSQPAVGQAFEQHAAGRALSAFNLVIFTGVFGIQWSIGLLIDAAVARGHDEALAFRFALAVFWGLSLLSYLWFLLSPRKRAAR